MSVELIMLPSETPVTWKAFRSKYGAYAIGIDGFVADGPRQDLALPCINMNHHEGVDRASTDSTCAQALTKVREGMMSRLFRRDGEPYARVYANDCDEDVCTTWVLLNNAWMFEAAANPKINKLVAVENNLDKSAGSYPYHPDMPFLQEMAWIFFPYNDFRAKGGLATRDPDSFKQVVFSVEARVLQYLADKADKLPLDTGYEMVGGSSKVALITNAGPHARMAMAHTGIEAYVLFYAVPTGGYRMTVGKFSSINPLDVELALSKLTEAETNGGTWGGGNMVGGSDRNLGTALKPEEVLSIVQEC